MKRLRRRPKSRRKNKFIIQKQNRHRKSVLFLEVENKDNFRHNGFVAMGAWWNWYTRTLEVRMPYGLEVQVLSRPLAIYGVHSLMVKFRPVKAAMRVRFSLDTPIYSFFLILHPIVKKLNLSYTLSYRAVVYR